MKTIKRIFAIMRFVWISIFSINVYGWQTGNEEYIPKVIIEAKWGNGLNEFGFIAGKGKEPSSGPSGIAVDILNDIQIVDYENKRLIKYANDGKYLETINLERKSIKVKRKIKNPNRLFAEKVAKKNPKYVEEMFGKSLKDIPEYEEREIEIDSNPFPRKIKISHKGKILHCGVGEFPEQHVITIYNVKGEIIRGFTKKEVFGNETVNTGIMEFNLDEDENVYLRINDKEGTKYGVTITNNLGKVEKIPWERINEQLKSSKFAYARINYINIWDILPISSLEPKLSEMVKHCRDWYFFAVATDKDSNIYELVWDEKNVKEGVKVIKWQKVR